MAQWRVELIGPVVVLEAETKEEAERLAIQQNNWVAYGVPKEIGVEVDKHGWPLKKA